MITRKENLRTYVLKVGPHGTKISTNSYHVSVVHPTYAVIFVRKNNYGHPTSETLSRLKTAKVNVLLTNK